MEFCRAASRVARAGFATATTVMPVPMRLSVSLAPFQRPFSTTVPRLALPPPPPPPPSRPSASFSSSNKPASAAAAPAAPWPPRRDQAASSRLAARSGASAAASADPLKDLYTSKDPAEWAFWSADDFYKQHLGASGADSPKQHLRLRPTTGRTVHVSGNVDQARAFALTDTLVRRNQIKNDHFLQRFHERPGLRRKRLRNLRWGKRFRANFIATAKRVQELAKQGW